MAKKQTMEEFYEQEDRRRNEFANYIPPEAVVGGGAHLPELDEDGCIVGEADSVDDSAEEED